MRRWYRFLVLKVDMVVGREGLISGDAQDSTRLPRTLESDPPPNAEVDCDFVIYFCMHTPINVFLHSYPVNPH